MAKLINGKQITKRFYNGNEILESYRGGNLVYGSGQSVDPTPLPYTKLQYISSGDYNDYLAIDTGVLANNAIRVVADIQWNAHNTQVQRFGSQWFTSSGDYYTYAFGTTESGWSINSGYSTSTGKWSVSSSRDTNRHVFDMQYYSPYLAKFDSQTNNIPNTGTAQPPSDVCTVHLFGRSRWTGTSIERDNYCSCKLYSCQIYNQAGTLIRDFVPAQVGEDVGMYDNVTNQLFLSWNGYSFTAGPVDSDSPDTPVEPELPYEELEYLTIPVGSYFDTGVTMDKEIIWELDIAPIISGTSSYYAGSSGGSQYTRIGIYNKKWYVYNTSGPTATNGIRYYVKYTLPLKTSSVGWKLQVDNGTTYTGSTSRVTNINTTTLRSKYSNSYNGLSGNYYGMDITYGGTHIGDYIPVRRKSDNVVCFYNKIDGTYLTAASGTWTAGPTL